MIAHVQSDVGIGNQLAVFAFDRHVVRRLKQIQHHFQIFNRSVHRIHLAPIQGHNPDVFLIQLIFHIRRFAFGSRHYRRGDHHRILTVQPQHGIFAQSHLMHPSEHMIAGAGYDHHDIL